MAHSSRTGALAGTLAAILMAASPAQAAQHDLSLNTGSASARSSALHIDLAQSGPFGASQYDESAEANAYHGRRYRGYRRYRRDRVDAGDVVAGVLILGTIAAVASAAANSRDRDRYRDRDYDYDYDRRYDPRYDNRRYDPRYDNRRYDNRRYDSRRYDDRRYGGRAEGSGLDNAVSQCLARIERDVRVERVDDARRIASGWIVTGRLYDGEGFTCRIGNDGQISDVDYGDYGSLSAVTPGVGQRSDTYYADARASLASGDYVAGSTLDAQVDSDDSGELRPAYPGGPLPGEAEEDGFGG